MDMWDDLPKKFLTEINETSKALIDCCVSVMHEATATLLHMLEFLEMDH